MDARQARSVSNLFYRGKHPFPRGALRLYPLTARAGGYNTDLMRDPRDVMVFAYFNRDVFVNLFSEDQRKSKDYDMVFLDIDDSLLTVSYLRLMAVMQALDAEKIKYAVVFSGSKGFHVYVPFKSTVLSSYRDAVMGWLKSKHILEHVDVRTVEDNRVTRMPHSRNTKSGKYYIPLNRAQAMAGISAIVDMARRPCYDQECFMPNPNLRMADDLKEHDREVVTKDFGQMKSESRMFASEADYPDCIKKMLSMARDGTDLGHYERLELGVFLLHATGGDVDQVANVYSQMSDYNEGKTKYYLEYAMERGLHMSRCERLIGLGICPYRAEEAASRCMFHPTMNRFMAAERT